MLHYHEWHAFCKELNTVTTRSSLVTTDREWLYILQRGLSLIAISSYLSSISYEIETAVIAITKDEILSYQQFGDVTMTIFLCVSMIIILVITAGFTSDATCTLISAVFTFVTFFHVHILYSSCVYLNSFLHLVSESDPWQLCCTNNRPILHVPCTYSHAGSKRALI